MKRKKRKSRKKKVNFSKLLMVAVVLVCLEIIVYAEIAMWVLQDLSALYALIGIVAGLAVSIWAYCSKSTAENTSGGIVYDLAMKKADSEKVEG